METEVVEVITSFLLTRFVLPKFSFLLLCRKNRNRSRYQLKSGGGIIIGGFYGSDFDGRNQGREDGIGLKNILGKRSNGREIDRIVVEDFGVGNGKEGGIERRDVVERIIDGR